MDIHIHIRGAVQGVGFRPTVYRVAAEMGLAGAVENTLDGVHIYLRHSTLAEAKRLTERVADALPPAARIEQTSWQERAELPAAVPQSGFTILMSDNQGGEPTDVSPDMAICADCLRDIAEQPRRRGYLLTNCTNCGPRFSIITALPYDRPMTTMRRFEMCDDCRREYRDPLDRRFHAQPVSCLRCGPDYAVTDPAAELAERLRRGERVVVKGVGGYNIMCDARSAAAVGELRELKRRPRKPFAVMMPSEEVARRYVTLSPAEAEALRSWRAPIVVAEREEAWATLPEEVAPGCRTLGVMLPYMGLHHALARLEPEMPVVVTSANWPGHPIITDDADAARYAEAMRMALIGYNREIANREDDSVVRIAAGQQLIYRRARGFAPEPMRIGAGCDGIVGMGADVTSQWALGRGRDIIQSPYIGSLLGGEGEDALRESVGRLTALFASRPRLVAVDAHPRYASTRVGRELARQWGAELREVWHHHAHALSVMADRGITDRTLALVLDGTGAGPDSTIWGSELLDCDQRGFEVLAHGPYLPMPGGDAASREPWRMALSAVMALDGGSPERLPAGLREAVGEEPLRIAATMVGRRLNSPQSRGAGRLWDAMAALLGAAYTNGYEAEAPILLEQLARRGWPAEPYPLVAHAEPLSVEALLGGAVADVARGERPEVVAARFHATFAARWAAVIAAHARRLGRRRVVASGGVMQNVILVEELDRLLRAAGVELLLPRRTPVNDACIAVGQIYASLGSRRAPGGASL